MAIYNRYLGMKIQSPEEEIRTADMPILTLNPEGFGESMGDRYTYKERLIKEALQLGIPARRTWGIDKLRKCIDDAK